MPETATSATGPSSSRAARSILSRSARAVDPGSLEKADPSGLTLKLKLSLLRSSISARADQFVLKAKLASLAGAALLTVASIPAPALFRGTAGVLTESRL